MYIFTQMPLLSAWTARCGREAFENPTSCNSGLDFKRFFLGCAHAKDLSEIFFLGAPKRSLRFIYANSLAHPSNAGTIDPQ